MEREDVQIKFQLFILSNELYVSVKKYIDFTFASLWAHISQGVEK